VPLELQDVALWDRTQISNAENLLHDCNRSNCWPAIVALYDHLVASTSSPVAALNRAAASAEVAGQETGLAELSAIAKDKRVLAYQPYWAMLGHLNLRAGHIEPTRAALTMAIGLSTDDAVRSTCGCACPCDGPTSAELRSLDLTKCAAPIPSRPARGLLPTL
jgi:RNA polymerase sigma-70 factor (ECF subfamily)